jgi:drug/metabolite transporter (DMT)-like permease
VIVFALHTGGGRPQMGDLLMLVAVAIGGLGYAQGGRLAREIGGWQVICWALVLSAPVLAVPVGVLSWMQHLAHPALLSSATWLGFAYITLMSQFVGFFAWYAGLARGGIARVGQVQLLQIFFTIALSALLFGEHVAPVTWLFGTAVVATVALSRRTAVRHVPMPAAGIEHAR